MRDVLAMEFYTTSPGLNMSAIPIHRINDLELRAEWTSRDFVSFHINYWYASNRCITVVLIKGTSNVEYLRDRAFNSCVSPTDLHELLRIAFDFVSSIPQGIPVIYHLEQLYPEYFI